MKWIGNWCQKFLQLFYKKNIFRNSSGLLWKLFRHILYQFPSAKKNPHHANGPVASFFPTARSLACAETTPLIRKTGLSCETFHPSRLSHTPPQVLSIGETSCSFNLWRLKSFPLCTFMGCLLEVVGQVGWYVKLSNPGDVSSLLTWKVTSFFAGD